MKVTIKTAELLHDIRTQSQDEVAGIQDVDARYRAEAGTDKMDEILRNLTNAKTIIVHTCSRFLNQQRVAAMDDTLAADSEFVFEFELSQRRRAASVNELADAIHSFLVDMTLSFFYETVQQPELQDKRSKSAMATRELIQHMLFTKSEPGRRKR